VFYRMELEDVTVFRSDIRETRNFLAPHSVYEALTRYIYQFLASYFILKD
jgi:hypothetical protein